MLLVFIIPVSYLTYLLTLEEQGDFYLDEFYVSDETINYDKNNKLNTKDNPSTEGDIKVIDKTQIILKKDDYNHEEEIKLDDSVSELSKS